MLNLIDKVLMQLDEPNQKRKKYEHEIRDGDGNPVFRLGGTGMQGGMEPQPSIDPKVKNLAGAYELIASQSTIGPGGAGVTTMGWRMFEDENEDRMAVEKDWPAIVQRLLQGLHDAAQRDPSSVAALLRTHPHLSEGLSNAVWGEGGGDGGGSGGGGGGGAV
jgi:hypothetical protein